MRAREFLLIEGLVEGPVVNGRIVPRLQSGKPPTTLYRIMSRDEYNAGMKDGKFMSKDGRVHADIKPHFQYAEPGSNNVLVSIQYNDDDGWKIKWAGNKCIAITSIPIPADRVAVLASGTRNDLENQEHIPVDVDVDDTTLDEEIIVEKNIKLDNDVSVFENPTTSQLHALTRNAQYNLMRGMFLERDNKWTLYTWPAYAMSHEGFLNEFNADGNSHIDFILSNDKQNLQQAKEWKYEPVYESSGFYFSLYTASTYLKAIQFSVVMQFSPFRQIDHAVIDKSEDPKLVNEINLIPDLDDATHAVEVQNQWSKNLEKRCKKLGRIGSLILYYSALSASGFIYYYLVSNNSLLGKAQVSKEARINRHPTVTVKHIWFDPSIRGQGYGMKFYEYLLKQGNNIIADGQQTQYSQGLWKSLARKYKVCPLLDGNQLGQPVTDLSNFYSRLEPNSSTLIALAR